VLLHGRVSAVKEGPVKQPIESVNGSGEHVVVETGIGSSGCWEGAPCGSALLGGLAEKEAELLKALGENVFARHGVTVWSGGFEEGGIVSLKRMRALFTSPVIRSSRDDCRYTVYRLAAYHIR